MTELATIADVETWLGLPSGNADEALLVRLIGAVSAAAESWCGRGFGVQAWSETRDGSGGRRLSFANPPVTAVTGIWIDGRAIAASSGAPQPGYLWSITALTLIGWRFTRGRSNVVLAYEAGYPTIPADLEQAALEWIAHLYRAKDRVGLTAETLAGQATPFLVKDMPPGVAALLAPYRSMVPA
jgi:hypothetical protein